MTHVGHENIFKFLLKSQDHRDLPLIVSNPLNNIVIEYEMEKNVMIKIEFHYFYMDSEWGEFEKLLSTRSNFIVMQNSWSRRSWICLLHRSLSSFSYFFFEERRKVYKLLKLKLISTNESRWSTTSNLHDFFFCFFFVSPIRCRVEFLKKKQKNRNEASFSSHVQWSLACFVGWCFHK